MLTLTRKENQEIVMQAPGGKPVVIRVLSIDRGVVRLGIDAAKEVTIYRAELLERIKESEQC